MPALISSPGVYTANESCIYEGSGRLKNSITTLGFAWPAFHNPLPRLVRRSRAETTLPLRRGWRKKKKKEEISSWIYPTLGHLGNRMKQNYFASPFTSRDYSSFLLERSLFNREKDPLFRDTRSRKIRNRGKKGVNGEIELGSIR